MKKISLKTTKTEDLLTHKIYSDPRYKGKHVIVMAGKIYTAKTGEKAYRLLQQLRKKHPRATPLVTYISGADTLVL
ncbi:MAG: hypothetical protein HY459_01790 [Parcubacteria group bacterium]|nr:hypothetical protein [Parcubacteria group bacterium]